MASSTPSDNRPLGENEQRGALRPFGVSGSRSFVTGTAKRGFCIYSVTDDLPRVTDDLPENSVMQVICHDIAYFALPAGFGCG